MCCYYPAKVSCCCSSSSREVTIPGDAFFSHHRSSCIQRAAGQKGDGSTTPGCHCDSVGLQRAPRGSPVPGRASVRRYHPEMLSRTHPSKTRQREVPQDETVHHRPPGSIQRLVRQTGHMATTPRRHQDSVMLERPYAEARTPKEAGGCCDPAAESPSGAAGPGGEERVHPKKTGCYCNPTILQSLDCKATGNSQLNLNSKKNEEYSFS